MALDSAGYNTSALFQAKDYDPTALATGLQSAATYDPTQQSTQTPSSAVRFVQNLNSPNTAYQDTASTTQNTSGSATAQDTSNTAISHAGTSGLTAASNNTINSSYAANIPHAKLVTAASAAANLNGTGNQTVNPGGLTTAQVNALNPYAGPQIVAIPVTYSNPRTFHPNATATGAAYYQFNPQTGQYTYIGAVDQNGRTFGGQPGVTAAQMQSATHISSVTANAARNGDGVMSSQGAAILNDTAVAGAINTWNAANQASATTNLTTQQTTAKQSAYDTALNYMTTHGGQLDRNSAAILANQYAGSGASVSQAAQAGIQAAQAAYAAQAAHASQLAGLSNSSIDTSASDKTDQAAMNSLISQYASGNSGLGGGANSAAVYNAGSLAGQNQLNHEKAAATSYNNNVANYNAALTALQGQDTSATGNQLYSDIQSVQQVAAQLQQEMGQLSTTKQQQAQTSLDNLNGLVQQYQAAVAQYGQASQQAMNLAKGILSAGAMIAVAV